MKYLIFIISLMITSKFVLSRNDDGAYDGLETFGKPIDGGRSLFGQKSILSRAAATATCSNVYGSICSDCNTLLTCVGVDPPLLTQNCAVSYPGRPYCVNNRCTNEIDVNNNENGCSTGIRCTSEGYFPNPTNCTQYYFCSGPLGDSILYECPIGYVYNPIGKNCKRRLTVADCNTVNCAANVNRYVLYPGDRAYYTFCYENMGIIEPIMFRCRDPDNYQYNVNTQTCEFHCAREGRIADTENCQRYFECYRSGASFVSVHQTCLTGYKFDTNTMRCIRGSCQTVITNPDEPSVAVTEQPSEDTTVPPSAQ